MKKINGKMLKFVAIALIIVAWILIFCATFSTMSEAKIVKPDSEKVLIDTSKKGLNFDRIHNEVKEFYLTTVGTPVRTQTVEITIWDPNSTVIAYCRPGGTAYPQYISFNYFLINKYSDDIVFQIILHEYTHCEGGIGHIQMPKHFMNDGGNPELTKEETKKQFIEFLKYYRSFYKIIKG